MISLQTLFFFFFFCTEKRQIRKVKRKDLERARVLQREIKWEGSTTGTSGSGRIVVIGVTIEKLLGRFSRFNLPRNLKNGQ